MSGAFTHRLGVGGGGGSGGDPDFANVVLLANFDGVDGGTSFVDDSPSAHTLTARGNTQTDEAVQKFTNDTLLLDGNGDYVELADSDDWAFGSGEFTVEGWFYLVGSTGVQRTMIAQWGGSGSRGWQVLYNGTGGTLQAYFSTSGSNSVNVNSDAWAPSTDTFYHVVWERSGDTFRTYVDGVMLGKTVNTSTLFNAARILEIGAVVGGSVGWSGNIFDVRITKGVARYASDSGYTVPTAPFPRS